MSKEQIEERNELVELLEDIGHDWDAYIDECQENEEQPQLSYEDFHADAILEAGYRKQIEGEWIWTENGEADCEKYWVCSVCKEHDFVKTKYCPNCGAKMKGDRKEDEGK